MAILDIAHILWETSKPTIVLTDKKSVTRFFQTKAIPRSLWKACDYVLQFNFKIAHIADSVNTAADFLSRLELKDWRGSASRSGKMYKQHPLRSKHPPLMLQMKNNSSLHKQMVKLRLNNKPLKGKTISEKGNRLGSTWGTIFNEAKYQRIYKDWRKRYVVLHTQNQSKCTDTGRTWCRSSLEKLKTQNTWPAIWRSDFKNRQAI